MRRMAKYLQTQGFAVGRSGVRRYYRIMGLAAVYPYNRQRMHQALDYKTPEFIYFEKNIVLKSLIYENSIQYICFFF